MGGEVLAEVLDVVGHAAWAEDVGLGVAADEEGELDVGHGGEEGGSPFGGAFGAWGEVSALGVAAGVAEAHGEDGDAGGVVELVFGHAEPGAEADSAGVGPGGTADVDLGAGGLAGDEDGGGGADAKDGAGAEGEAGAERAGSDLGGERF